MLVASAGTALGEVLAEAEYSYEDNGATLVVTVGKGDEAPFDPSKITAGVTKIAKRGEGVLMAEASTSSAMSSYTGNFSVEQGVYWYKHAYAFGAHGAATVDILDGAMIRSSSSTVGVLDNKTVNFYGAPPKAQYINGTWYSMRGKTHLGGVLNNRIGENVRIVLHEVDSTFFFEGSNGTLIGTFDLDGHTLTIESTGETITINIGGSVTNGGSIVVSNAAIINIASANLEFAADCAANSSLRLAANGIINFKSGKTLSNGWTLEMDGGHARGNYLKKPTDTTYPNWDGPVKFVSDSTMASYSGYSQWAYTTVFNVHGPIYGTGAASCGPGWLNLFSTDAASNTFSGTVTVTGQSADQTKDWKTPPGGGGIGVWNGALCFPCAESITFTDSARFEFMDDTPTTVPTLTFAGGAGDVQTIKGGVYTNRSTVAGINKTGDGTLIISSPVHVTGRVAVSGGVLQIPGVGGLRESMLTSSAGNVLISLEPWNIDPTKHIDEADMGIRTDGPHVLLSQDNWPKSADRPSQPYGYVYRGYVWNDQDAPVTMKVLHGLLPYTHVWFGSDHSTSMEFKGSDLDPKEVVLQPGSTEVLLYGYTYGKNIQWWNRAFGTVGLIYATNTTWTVEEFSEALRAFNEEPSPAHTNALKAMVAEMSPFKDDGSGSFLSTYLLEGEESPQPIIDNLVFSNGATLDLRHATGYYVKNLTGSPTVTNAAEFGVTNHWTICADDFPKADASVRRPMTVDGKLVFANGATFSVDDDSQIVRSPVGVVVATAKDGIVGRPRQSEGGSERWRLFASGNSLYLRAGSGLVLIVR